ncbi:tetratricopeptide repeat protein [Corynebacterium auriscanis]|uniref:tetratricopeptide repeat protein n=1 Tax=Corynebacterium auriscanis TaxID=99807 RepID=UPI0024ADAE24|nr:tetratricopeptide repeat protein [Corynebacterium auriscanis]
MSEYSDGSRRQGGGGRGPRGGSNRGFGSRGRDGRRGDNRDRGFRNRDENREGGRGGRRNEEGGGNREQRRGNRGGFKSNRGGQQQRERHHHAGPQRSGYREERINKRISEPSVPNDIDPKDLDPSVRQELRSLSKDNADMVAKHLIMTALLLDEKPKEALAHARAAKDRAGRVAVARETCGIAAYHAGEWKEAIAELRAARRMSGGPGMLAVLADAERGLGRPDKALEVANEFDPSELDAESQVELAIVVAGAHSDMGQYEDAVLALESQLDNSSAPQITQMRLFYAYADALVELNRLDEAHEWFTKAGQLDEEKFLDIEDRLEEISRRRGQDDTE